jgi:hypothetical protein
MKSRDYRVTVHAVDIYSFEIAKEMRLLGEEFGELTIESRVLEIAC